MSGAAEEAAAAPAPDMPRSSTTGSGTSKPELTKYQSLQAYVWDVLEDMTYNALAQVIGAVMMTCIAISIVAFAMLSVPDCSYVMMDHGSREFQCKEEPLGRASWEFAESVCIIIFSIEFVLRVWACPVRGGYFAFVKNWQNWVDFVAIAPWYIDFIPTDGGTDVTWLAVLRVVRLTRVVRVFKVGAKFQDIQVLGKTILRSSQAMVMLFVFLLVLTILFSTLIFHFEGGVYDYSRKQYVRIDGTDSPFESIPSSFWWCLVTMTTVGYGDELVVSSEGKIVAICTMCTGLIVLSLPITIIGANFEEEYQDNNRQNELAARAERQRQLAGSGEDPEKVGASDENPNDPNWQIQQLIMNTHEMMLEDINGLITKSEDDLKRELVHILDKAKKAQQARLLKEQEGQNT